MLQFLVDCVKTKNTNIILTQNLKNVESARFQAQLIQSS